MAKTKTLSAHKLIFRLFDLIIVVGLLMVLVDNTVIARIKAPLPSIRPQLDYSALQQPAKTVPLAWPAYGESAIGAIGYGLLATSGDQHPVPTASTAKLITALAVLKVKPLKPGEQGPLLTMTAADVARYSQYAAEDGSVTRVAVGEQLSEYQVLEAMLLPSANNLADSLAVWAFGSLPAYHTYANRLVKQLGLNHTHIGSDASGFLPDTTSTAGDLVKLGVQAAADPVIADIVARTSAQLPVAGTVHNVNALLGWHGINGLKTGNSNQAGGVYLFSAPYTVTGGRQITIVGAVMHASSLSLAMHQAEPLLLSGQKAFGYTTTLAAGQQVGLYSIPWQGTVSAVTTAPVMSLTWQGRPLDSPLITLSDITAPQAGRAAVGSISYHPGGHPCRSPVVLSQPIVKPTTWWRLKHD